jgi:hypothetical protein
MYLVVLKTHLEHRRVLQREPARRRNLPELLEIGLAHHRTSLMSFCDMMY